jgi:uncharacterized protein YjbI with pentapeptide repeats
MRRRFGPDARPRHYLQNSAIHSPGWAGLSSVKLAGDDFANLNLAGANPRGADLSNANCSNTNLSGTKLKAATGLSSAMLTGVIWSSTACPDNTTSNADGGTCIGQLSCSTR